MRGGAFRATRRGLLALLVVVVAGAASASNAPAFAAPSLVGGLAVAPSSPVAADDPVHYTLSLDTEAKVWSATASFPVESADRVDLWFARWTAGAYHLAEFGQSVDQLSVQDADGKQLPVTRESDCHFVVAAGGATPLHVSWTARSISSNGYDLSQGLDVESNRISADYAYVNPPSLFPFVPALQDRAIRLDVTLPEGWKCATGMDSVAGAADPSAETSSADASYSAASWWRLEDSPLLMSPEQRTSSFEVEGVRHDVTVLGRSEKECARITEGCEKIVRSCLEVMGRLPYEHYHFLIAFVPEGQGSGLEHENSTLIILTPALPAGPFGDETLYALIAHEYFHLWFAERIKVESLVRPDYTQPVDTSTIWVNEGINEYFTQHLLLRAGLRDRESFFQYFSNTMALMPRLERPLSKTPWTEMSRKMATWTQDPTGIQLFVLRCYQVGPVVIFGLDLEMRRLSDGEKGLVDAFRVLDERYVQQGEGFPEGTMIDLLGEVVGADLRPFYDQYIAGPALPDMNELLEVLGYRTRGGLRIVQSVEDPTEEQLAARADFFELPENANSGAQR